MEADFLNLYDGEKFLYHGSQMLDEESALMGFIRDDFLVESKDFPDNSDLWGTEQELNGDLAVLPISYPIDSLTKCSSQHKEDFHKLLSDFQDQSSNFQSLSDCMNVRTCVSMDLVMPKLIFEEPPDDIFDNSHEEFDDFKYKLSLPMLTSDQMQINSVSSGDEIEMDYDGDIDSVLPMDGAKPMVDLLNLSEEVDMPALEAKDIKSLLEQFEASEVGTPDKESLLCQKEVSEDANKLSSNVSHNTIKDSLPKEVIERIKTFGKKKKLVPLIPAMPSKNCGKGGVRMQDAANVLCRNKLLKIISGGESVQLDHDYCYGSSNNSGADTLQVERLENDLVNVVQIKKEAISEIGLSEERKPDILKEIWDKNARKDSGLESGEVSDASEEMVSANNVWDFDLAKQLPSNLNGYTAWHMNYYKAIKSKFVSDAIKSKIVDDKSKTIDTSVALNSGDNERNINLGLAKSNVNRNGKKEMMMVSVLKKTQQPAVKETKAVGEVIVVQEPVKRKLNIEEYRNRLKELDRIRGNKESNNNSPVPSPSSADSIGCSKMIVEPAVSHKNDVEGVKNFPQCVKESAGKTEGNRTRKSREIRNKRSRRNSSRHSSCSSSSGHSSDDHCSRRRRDSDHYSGRRRRNRGSHSLSGRSSSSAHTSRSNGYHSRSRSLSSDRSSPPHSRNSTRSWSNSRRNERYKWKSGRSNNRSSPKHSTYRSWRRSRSPPEYHRYDGWTDREKRLQVEERRVIYVGRIEEGTSKAELRRRFEQFGPILDISVHFREHGDNYGFVTFAYKRDAYHAVEHGNDNPSLPRYDLCFGGRRAFCKTRYSDLDGMASHEGFNPRYVGTPASSSSNSFDLLLRQAQANLRNRQV